MSFRRNLKSGSRYLRKKQVFRGTGARAEKTKHGAGTFGDGKMEIFSPLQNDSLFFFLFFFFFLTPTHSRGCADDWLVQPVTVTTFTVHALTVSLCALPLVELKLHFPRLNFLKRPPWSLNISWWKGTLDRVPSKIMIEHFKFCQHECVHLHLKWKRNMVKQNYETL